MAIAVDQASLGTSAVDTGSTTAALTTTQTVAAGCSPAMANWVYSL